MNEEIGTQFLFSDYVFRIFGSGSLQCRAELAVLVSNLSQLTPLIGLTPCSYFSTPYGISSDLSGMFPQRLMSRVPGRTGILPQLSCIWGAEKAWFVLWWTQNTATEGLITLITDGQDLTTVDGASIWAGDGIHLTSNASRVAARKLMADLAHGGQEGEPAAKRTRLESVVPAPAPAKKKEVAKSDPPPPPPRPCPPPLWLSGQLPPTPTNADEGQAAKTPPPIGGGGLLGITCAAATAAAGAAGKLWRTRGTNYPSIDNVLSLWTYAI